MFRSSNTAGQLTGLRRAAASSPMLSVELEQELARRAGRGDAEAFERLISAHIRLVFAVAGDYVRFGVSLDELVSEGMVGLVTAARRYDPERGVRLAAYASYWIRMKLRRFTLHNRRMVRPPASRRGRAVMASLANVEHELAQAYGAPPDRETLAQHLGASAIEVEEMRLALRGRDAALSGGDTQESGIALASDEPSPEALAETHELQAQNEALLMRAFGHLKPRERDVLMRRHLAQEAPSLSAIGAELGISRERVRQIEARGYEKLREAVLRSVA